MTHVRMSGAAFGHPGLEPRWTTGAKVGVGTACNPVSKVWFTLAKGIVTEVYYPRLDTANTRDLQFLISDGRHFLHEEQRDLQHTLAYIDPHALAYRLINTDPQRRYRLLKRICTDPEADALVIRTRFEVLTGSARDYALYFLLAPHVGNRGYGNSGQVVTVDGRRVLLAWREGIYTALAASLAVQRASCGFVGVSDGWQDLHDDFAMDWEFASASDGNLALTGELDLAQGHDFTVALGFGGSEEEAIAIALRTVHKDFEALERRYIQEWQEYCASLEDLSAQSTDGGRLFWISAMVLKALEDKTYPGAFIAAPAIPWGEAAGDRNPAGYHLVWPRDLVQVATACLALGDGQAALRALKYLDRVQDKALVKPAALYLARCGPVTEQERWEENAGYSPSTLAAEIAGLVCAAAFAELHGEPQLARYFREVADAWATKLEAWTFTTCGQLLPGHAEYYERIATVRLTDGLEGDPNWSCLPIRNLPAGVAPQFPQCVLCPPGAFCQCCIVDGGFLELVRYGLRAPDDPHILKTLPVYDAILKVDTPNGPAWHRYNYDGYGEKRDGSPYDGTGGAGLASAHPRTRPLRAGRRL